MVYKELLPLGSVVSLKEAQQDLLILGIFQVTNLVLSQKTQVFNFCFNTRKCGYNNYIVHKSNKLCYNSMGSTLL